MHTHRLLLVLSLLIALGTVVLARVPYYSNAYSQSQYDSNRGDGRYGNREGDGRNGYANGEYGNGYGNSYGRPSLEIGVPASQPPSCRDDVTVTEGLIIDIRASDELGAVLLDGVNEQSFESCVSRCCLKAGCDMAVFKRYGLSNSDKNCYLVQCGKSENCKMVRQEGFATATTSTFAGKDGAGPNTENQPSQPSPGREDRPQSPIGPSLPLTRPTPLPTDNRATEQPPATAPEKTAQSETPAEPTSTPATTTEASAPGVTEPPPGSEHLSDAVDPTEERATVPDITSPGGSDSVATATGPSLVPESDQDPTESDGGDGEESKGDDDDDDSSEVSDGATGGSTGEDSDKAEEDPVKNQRPVITSSKGKGSGGRDVCGESGCNGASIIPVAVIGAISVVMLVVVVAIVLRKVVAIRRRRKFRNVDYLINGMYT